MEAIFRLVYGSHASVPFTKEQLLELLGNSQIRNKEWGISGLLLYREGVFLQMIEGPEEAVRSLFAKIRQDRRHHSVAILFEGYSPRRQFPDWSMSFRDLEDPLLLRNLGYSEFMNQPTDPSRGTASSSDLFTLLERFRSGS